jgi:ComF family protein
MLCKQGGTILCDACVRRFSRAVETPAPWIYSYFSYQNKDTRLVFRALKYRHNTLLPKVLVYHTVGNELKTFLNTCNNPVLIPIPMSQLRIWARGYNHAELIAEEFGKRLTMPTEKHLLLRAKNTPQQARSTGKNEREKNIRGAYKVNTKILEEFLTQNATPILVDDITTTGSTLTEAKRTLEKAGFKNIHAVTLAH